MSDYLLFLIDLCKLHKWETIGRRFMKNADYLRAGKCKLLFKTLTKLHTKVQKRQTYACENT